MGEKENRSLKKKDLSRIAVFSKDDFSDSDDDKIIVKEESFWLERNVELGNVGEDVLGDESGENRDIEDVVLSEENLSRALGDVVKEGEYKAPDEKSLDMDGADGGLGELYDSGENDLYNERGYLVSEKMESERVKGSVEIEDERRLGRSMLEVAGFSDEEAKRKRKAKKAFRGW